MIATLVNGNRPNAGNVQAVQTVTLAAGVMSHVSYTTPRRPLHSVLVGIERAAVRMWRRGDFRAPAILAAVARLDRMPNFRTEAQR